jgi:hypothetical protein
MSLSGIDNAIFTLGSENIAFDSATLSLTPLVLSRPHVVKELRDVLWGIGAALAGLRGTRCA